MDTACTTRCAGHRRADLESLVAGGQARDPHAPPQQIYLVLHTPRVAYLVPSQLLLTGASGPKELVSVYCGVIHQLFWGSLRYFVSGSRKFS